MSWQHQREMTPAQFEAALGKLKLTQAAAARFLGITARQVARLKVGERVVKVETALLLRSMIAHGDQPVVPKPTGRPQW
jgi:plasmid maintenance system antidote protein VapI